MHRRAFISRATALGLSWATCQKYLASGLPAGILLPGSMAPRRAEAAPRRGGTLRVSVSRTPNNLNPLRHGNHAEYMLGEMFYSNLVRLNDDLTPVPDLAESWSSNRALTEWTFRLRNDVHFHHGPALVADDVAATFQMLLRKETLSPARRNVGPIESVSVLDRRTVRFHLGMPYGDQAIALAYAAAKILPANILASDARKFDRQAFGTGPFRLLSYDPTRLVIAEQNPDYFVKNRPYLTRVEQHIFASKQLEIEAFIGGQIDLMLEVPSTEFTRVSAMPDIEGIRLQSGRFFDLVMANNVPPFNDLRVRKALQLSLDRKALVRDLLNGYGIPGGDTPIMPAYRYHSQQKPIIRDIDQARKLLVSAGYKSGIKLTLVASDRPAIRLRLANAVSEMAREAGFNIRVQSVNSETYLQQIWTKGSFYVGFYNMQPSEDHILSLLYTSNALWNQTRWNNAAFDELVEAARATQDSETRASYYRQAQSQMQRDVPTIIPLFVDFLAARRKRVAGLHLAPLGIAFHLEDAWIDDRLEIGD